MDENKFYQPRCSSGLSWWRKKNKSANRSPTCPNWSKWHNHGTGYKQSWRQQLSAFPCTISIVKGLVLTKESTSDNLFQDYARKSPKMGVTSKYVWNLIKTFSLKQEDAAQSINKIQMPKKKAFFKKGWGSLFSHMHIQRKWVCFTICITHCKPKYIPKIYMVPVNSFALRLV